MKKALVGLAVLIGCSIAYSDTSQDDAKASSASAPATDHHSPQKKITRVMWDGAEFEVSYRGTIGVEEEDIGPLQGWPDGLTFHPDGRIAFSEGMGTSKDMRIVFWYPDKEFDPVANIQYNKDKMRQMVAYASSDLNDVPEDERAAEHQRRWSESERHKAELEREGFFWFFGGPMAFDSAGTCYFSLGSCSPNGLYKVVSQDPVEIAKLRALESTKSLQVPLFDKDHLYSTSWNGIFRYSMEPSDETQPPAPWFSIIPRGGQLMNNTLIISPSRLLVYCLIRKDVSRRNSGYDRRTLLFDKNAKAFWSLPTDDFGPMAISWDGNRMIHFDRVAKTINEFSLEEAVDGGRRQ